MNREQRIERIVVSVFMAFIEGQDGIPVREIAERSDCTAPQVNSAVSRMFDKEGWQRIEPIDVEVPVRARNYGMILHHRRCRGFQVTRAFLRKLMLPYAESFVEKVEEGST